MDGEIDVTFEAENQTLPAVIELIGPTGASAYQQAVAGGYRGTEEEFARLLGALPAILENKMDKDGSKQLSDYNFTAEERCALLL
jgi:hypothetical protein